MHREMRRKDRQTTKEFAISLLQKCEYGILATSGKDNMPYAVPISYAYADDSIFLHCAVEGHKLDNIKANPKVSFTVVGNTNVLPDKFSTAFESTVIFGNAEILQDKEEKAKGLRALVEKYSPDFKIEGEEYINRAFDATCVVRINIEHITGKQRDE